MMSGAAATRWLPSSSRSPHRYRSQAKFTGQFMLDMFSGQGELLYADGSRLPAIMHPSLLNRFSVPNNARFFSYRGGWLRGMRHGHGEFVEKNGVGESSRTIARCARALVTRGGRQHRRHVCEWFAQWRRSENHGIRGQVRDPSQNISSIRLGI
jgi:hypothetical protein